MKDLTQLLQQCGFENVNTYIQSGNITLNSDLSTHQISAKIEQLISEHYGFSAPIVTLDSDEMVSIINNNPYLKDPAIQQSALYVAICKQTPLPENIAKLDPTPFLPDVFQIIDKVVYLKYQGNYGKSKLTNNVLEKKLKIDATTRNWNTMLEMLRRIQEKN